MTPAHPQNDPGEDPQPPRTPRLPAKRDPFSSVRKGVKRVNFGQKCLFRHKMDSFEYRGLPRALPSPDIMTPKKSVPGPKIPLPCRSREARDLKHRRPGQNLLGALCLRGHTLVGGRVRGLGSCSTQGSGPFLRGWGPRTAQKWGSFVAVFPPARQLKLPSRNPNWTTRTCVHLDVCVGLRSRMRLLTAGGPH